MAFLKSGFEFTGCLGKLSAYTLPGVEGTVLPIKGVEIKKRFALPPPVSRPGKTLLSLASVV